MIERRCLSLCYTVPVLVPHLHGRPSQLVSCQTNFNWVFGHLSDIDNEKALS